MDIASIAHGDSSAFRKLYDTLAPRLFYYLYRWVSDREVCEDILQEAMVMYWNRRHDFKDPLAVKVYLCSVARNLLSNHSRVEVGRRRIMAQLFDAPWRTDDAAAKTDGDHLLVSAEVAGIISSAVDQLPPRTASVIRLSMDDYSVQRIAEELGISENTVKSLKKSGYRTLRLKLEHLRPLLSILLYL